MFGYRCARVYLCYTLSMVLLIIVLSLFWKEMSLHGNDIKYAKNSYKTSQQTLKMYAEPEDVNRTKFSIMLHSYASQDGVILLSLVDSAFMDMCLNFFETSIKKHGIENYLYMASDEKACHGLKKKGINCFVYMLDPNAEKNTVYNSHDFNQKMNIRTFMILDALLLGYTVLHSDVDIVFLKNPFLDLDTMNNTLIALNDVEYTSIYNAGFVYIKPSDLSISVYRHMSMLAKTTQLDDQKSLNRAVKHVCASRRNSKCGPITLDKDKYLSGLRYFEHGNRYFGYKECNGCYVIHNNWIVSLEAKRYRFRESGLWLYDGNGYYTDINARYITYESNPNMNISSQLSDLKAALYFGHVLNRHVILPQLYVNPQSTRPLNNWINMAAFDGQFAGKYRESIFLEHPKVPAAIREGISIPMRLKFNTSTTETNSSGDRVLFLGYLSKHDILKEFGERNESVLKFHSFCCFYDTKLAQDMAWDSDFRARINKAFVTANYRQLN